LSIKIISENANCFGMTRLKGFYRNAFKAVILKQKRIASELNELF
jgi:hypothetical protein